MKELLTFIAIFCIIVMLIAVILGLAFILLAIQQAFGLIAALGAFAFGVSLIAYGLYKLFIKEDWEG